MHINKHTTTILTHIIATAIFITVFASCTSTKPMQAQRTNFANQQDSLLIDGDGNRYRIKLFLDGNLWMTTNLNLMLPNSYCYDSVKENCQKYGRLYTWESAREACKLLGETWRLPSADEWRQLSMLYGGSAGDSILSRKQAFQVLLFTGNSGFNAVLGGGRAPAREYARLEAHGFYWTETEMDSRTAWYYNFAKGSQALYRQDNGEKTRAFSVRCIKNIPTPN